MVIRHVLLLGWTAEAGPDQRAAAVRGFEELPGQIPQIKALSVATDAGLADDNADLMVTMDFADADAWRAYQRHPAHRAFIESTLRPILARRTALQCEHP